MCFYYVPQSFKQYSGDYELFCEKLGELTPYLKSEMVKRGNTLIDYASQGKFKNCFRMVFTNPDLTYDDMQFVLHEIRECAASLSIS